jgi:hypothetical protein
MEVTRGHQPSRECKWEREWRDIEWKILVVFKTRTEGCVADESTEE